MSPNERKRTRVRSRVEPDCGLEFATDRATTALGGKPELAALCAAQQAGCELESYSSCGAQATDHELKFAVGHGTEVLN